MSRAIPGAPPALSLGVGIRHFRGPDDRELIDLVGAPVDHGDEPAPGRFLARWDSIIIGYDQRDRILPSALVPEVIKHRNGDFLPSFTVDGFVTGAWSVVRDATSTRLELRPAIDVAKTARTELTDEAERLVRFIARDAGRHEVRWTAP